MPSPLSVRPPNDGKLGVVKLRLFPSGSVDDIFTSSVSPSFIFCAEIKVSNGLRFTSSTVKLKNTVSDNDGFPSSTAIT